jgi:hypothetical protein
MRRATVRNCLKCLILAALAAGRRQARLADAQGGDGDEGQLAGEDGTWRKPPRGEEALRVRQLVEEQEADRHEPHEALGSEHPATSPLSIHDMTVAYDRRPVLWDIDLTLPGSALAGIVAPVVEEIGEALVFKHAIDTGEEPSAERLAEIVDQAILPAVGIRRV